VAWNLGSSADGVRTDDEDVESVCEGTDKSCDAKRVNRAGTVDWYVNVLVIVCTCHQAILLTRPQGA
jgi:hypothetical protein